MFKKIFTLSFIGIFIAGCEPVNYPEKQSNPVVRRQVFKECLANVPKGPIVTGNENPWDKIVTACENAAYHQSFECVKYCPEFVKKEND